MKHPNFINNYKNWRLCQKWHFGSFSNFAAFTVGLYCQHNAHWWFQKGMEAFKIPFWVGVLQVGILKNEAPPILNNYKNWRLCKKWHFGPFSNFAAFTVGLHCQHNAHWWFKKGSRYLNCCFYSSFVKIFVNFTIIFLKVVSKIIFIMFLQFCGTTVQLQLSTAYFFGEFLD